MEVLIVLDKEILETFLNKKIQLINDEHFVISGKITRVFDNSIAFFTDGKVIYLGNDRILEIRPLGDNNYDK